MVIKAIIEVKKLIEQLIEEHGSSKILRDHIALFKDMILKSESEKNSLKLDNDNLRKDFESMKQSLIIFQDQYATNYIDEFEEKVLKHIFDKDNRVSKEELCSVFNMQSSVMKCHIDSLSRFDFITPPAIIKAGGFTLMSAGGNEPKDIYIITSKGRKYVKDNLLH